MFSARVVLGLCTLLSVCSAAAFSSAFGYLLVGVLQQAEVVDDYIAPPLELGAPDEGNGGLVGGILGPLGALFGLAGLYCWYRSKSAGDDRTKLMGRAPPKSTPSVKVHTVGAGNELTVHKIGGSMAAEI